MKRHPKRRPLIIAFLLFPPALPAGEIVADFVADLASPVPAPGWAYMWNSGGAIDNPENYTNLVVNPGLFGGDAYTAESTYPSPGPANFMQVYSEFGSVNPGKGTAQNGIQRYVILAYTIQRPGITRLINGRIRDNQTMPAPPSIDGVNVRVQVNGGAPVFTGSIADTGTLNFGPLDLGLLLAGDTVYVAIGANGSEGVNNDFQDQTLVRFKIEQSLPELAIARDASSGAVRLSWEDPGGLFILQDSTEPSPLETFGDLPTPYPLDGTTRYFEVSNPQGARFFRLRQP